MKRTIFILLSFMFLIASVNAATNYVYFNAKFVKDTTIDKEDKKVYYSNGETTYYKDISENSFDRKYKTTYRDLKRNYKVRTYNAGTYQINNLRDKSEVFYDRHKRKENIQTDRTKYIKDKKETHTVRWRNYMTSSDYLNNYFN